MSHEASVERFSITSTLYSHLKSPLSALQGWRQTHGSMVMFHGVLDSLCHVSDIKSVLDNCVESDGALWTRVIEQDRAGLLLVLCFSLACLK